MLRIQTWLGSACPPSVCLPQPRARSSPQLLLGAELAGQACMPPAAAFARWCFCPACPAQCLSFPPVPLAGAKDMCTWAACFGLGAVVGLFCINPDAGARIASSMH